MEIEEKDIQSRPLFDTVNKEKRTEDKGIFGTLFRKSQDESSKCEGELGSWRMLALVVSFVSMVVIVVLGIAAFVCSEVSNSSAEFAFAFDALLGLFSSGSVVWRFYRRLAPCEVPKKEKIACIIIAIGILLSALVMFIRALYCLNNHIEPLKTITIIVMSSLGFLCYSLLFYAKFKVAQNLHSVTMRTDSFDSACGAVMALGVLVSTIVYKHAEDTWWLDPVIAMVIAIVTFAYGISVVVKVRVRERFGEPEEYEQFY